ncbi:MAG: hypothetical protein SPJ13_01330 [Bacteroidales bacterium]|nr:hypothetical protein [Bacteroidales bacterium]
MNAYTFELFNLDGNLVDRQTDIILSGLRSARDYANNLFDGDIVSAKVYEENEHVATFCIN